MASGAERTASEREKIAERLSSVQRLFDGSGTSPTDLCSAQVICWPIWMSLAEWRTLFEVATQQNVALPCEILDHIESQIKRMEDLDADA